MQTVETLFDLVLAALLVFIGWRCTVLEDLFRSIVLYIAYGLLMALAWSRLRAPDVALAEAAIGAGLTGALLLDAVSDAPRVARSERRRASGLATALCILVGSGLATVVWPLSEVSENLPALTGSIRERLGEAGISQPVTAVLMNFRAFDTWLELGVLLLAVTGSLAIRRERGDPALRNVWASAGPIDPILSALATALTPALVGIAAYMLWAASHAPGGAFQAGALLGASGVLSLLTGGRVLFRIRVAPFLFVLVLGFGLFCVFAVSSAVTGRFMLEYPRQLAGTLLLVIEVASGLSIGMTLSALFAAARPKPKE